jgi:flagellar protein FliO/FliZ
MWTLMYWGAVLAIVAGMGVMAAVAVRAYQNGLSPSEVFFKPRPEPRIGVIEQASVDGKRRLVLIRRDDVEHLIMTGGPVDVVIETGIGEPRRPVQEAAPVATATVFTRPQRTFGQLQPGTPEDTAARG